MPRRTYEQNLADVSAAITAAGGTITHAALSEVVDRTVLLQLDQMTAQGHIVVSLDAQPNAKPVLSYRLPAQA